MKRHNYRLSLILILLAASAVAADWARFRGPTAIGTSDEAGLPVTWSSQENIAWKAELPGPGGSSPIVVGDRVYLTCYTGYGLEPSAGDMNNLMRHLLCFDRESGRVLWTKEFKPLLPEHEYTGEGAYHGYSSSTPVSDGERLYVQFGKSGLFCMDLDGNNVWQAEIGSNTHHWGSGCSPILHGDLVIVNASVECGQLLALDKQTGKEAWRAEGINSSWNTPLIVDVPGQDQELVVSVEGRIRGFDPQSGKALWDAEGIHRYVCPSVIAHEGIVYAIGGGSTSLAVRAGGRGDVSATHGLWRKDKGSNVSSPVYHEGHLYWASDSGGIVYCQNPATGEIVYQERLSPDSGLIYASPILADGKVYYVSQTGGTYVVAARPNFELLAHNVIEGDDSRINASPAVSNGRLLIRSDRFLYSIGN